PPPHSCDTPPPPPRSPPFPYTTLFRSALLDHGADVNVRDGTHGRTPLMFAAADNRLEAMKTLIAKGADLKQTTKVIDYVQRSARSEEHTSELQSRVDLVCRLLLEKKKR